MKTIAYFSMEIGISPNLPTYSGGLGILAGDTIKAAADLALPMVSVTLLHRKGYVLQTIGEHGEQLEAPEQWHPEQILSRSHHVVEIMLQGRPVKVTAWEVKERGVGGAEIPIFFLDTDLAENHPDDRRITDSLYGGDARMRVLQEMVLGVGGFRFLQAAGYGQDTIFHLNEGHAAFLITELLSSDWQTAGQDVLERTKRRCLFTTHTPVPAGHDVFPGALLRGILPPDTLSRITPLLEHDALNLTKLALRFSGIVNAVSRKHVDVTKAMFPEAKVVGITNGVHATRWVSEPFARLYDTYLPGWRERAEQLRQAALIPIEDIAEAHKECKEQLFTFIRDRYGMPFGGAGILLGFARRSTEYKRPLLILRDLDRLNRLAERFGPITLLFAGKAHPRDGYGKQIIQEIHSIAQNSGERVRIAFLPNYDVSLAHTLCAGVDVWLNTPRAPMEASGTSGMKCAMNGVPSLSTADGWWLEGGIEGVTGWVVRSALNEGGASTSDQDAADAAELYRQLEDRVLPCFYESPSAFAEIRRNAIAINGSFFNTHRMIDQYRWMAYERLG